MMTGPSPDMGLPLELGRRLGGGGSGWGMMTHGDVVSHPERNRWMKIFFSMFHF